ncbi:MAG: formate dehydrogenase subunit alpha [Bacteroidales bacterium]|nr:formate dehydrogenase subunit alpha [Bacteroidales bacterium]
MKTFQVLVDGKKIVAKEGANLLNLLRNHGFDIPGLCYHPRISPSGACRLCVVKIKGRPGTVMACTVQVNEDMEIIAFDEELVHERRTTLAHLLAEIDDKYDDTYIDELQPLIDKYDLRDLSKRPVFSLLDKISFHVDETSPVLTYDSRKCIKCFRCIKACDEIQGKGVLSMAERGLNSFVVAGVKNWKESECDGCGECIQLCPTGAIVEKPFRDKIKISQIERKVQTTCPYCGVGCQIEAWVQDGTIVRIRGVEEKLPNLGRLCVKGRFGYFYAQHPKRLTTPLIRKDGVLVESTWDEALNLIAQEFNRILHQYGSRALAGYSSAKCTNEENYLFQKFIRMVFRNNNVDYCTRLCHASTVAAMIRSLGDGAGTNSIEDFENTDCVLVIGNNMVETHPVTATFVKRGKKKGQILIVIDPKITPLAKFADYVLQPRLGTDVALLNGMMYYIFQEDLVDLEFIRNKVHGGEEKLLELKEIVMDYTPDVVKAITGVEPELVRAAAIAYAKSPTAIIATGMGMSQQTVGTNNVFALINLMLITGQIAKERSGINPPRGQNNVQGATDVGASPIYYPGYISISDEENRKHVASVWGIPFEELDPQPGLTTLEIMDAAEKGIIKGLYIMGENPVISDPDQLHTVRALQNLEFLVVQDIFLTETTAYAHVVLPATSLFEKDGTVVSSDRRVLRIRKVVDPPGDARPDWQIICDIAQRMGRSIGKYSHPHEIFDEIRLVTPIMRGITYERLEKEEIQWPCYDEKDPGKATLYLDKFNLPDGKAKIFPVQYQPQSELPNEEFPLVLNTGRLLYHYHTATMSRKNDTLNQYINESFIFIHPEDAKKLNLSENEKVRVISPRGDMVTKVKVSDLVNPGETFMPWHFHESPVNRLVRNEKDPISKIAPFKYSIIRIEKLSLV